MSIQIANWFTEKIKDKVTVQFQAHGGLLDGTMMSGDTQANTVKFPIIGRTEVYKLTGAIERVPVNGPGLTTVQLTMEDFEASDWWRVQDAYKAGPNEQAALVQIIVMAIRRKRDKIKLDALAAFAAGGFGVTTIGDGQSIIDVLDVELARTQIAATGADDTGEIKVFCALPAMWMSQLAFYEEFGKASWVGAADAPFSKTQRSKMKSVRGVTYIECPDEYFAGPDTDEWYAYMWHHDSMGAEMPWNQEAPTITRETIMQGSPYLVKAGLGGAAVGIQAAGVKRLWFQKQTALVRPPRQTVNVDVTP
ncbi:MAG: phage capsid protein [Rhizobiaceae bacterium]